MKIEFNQELDGYVITFGDSKTAHTQTYVEDNRLDADYGETFLTRYDEYDDPLSPQQHDAVEDFVIAVNSFVARGGDVRGFAG